MSPSPFNQRLVPASQNEMRPADRDLFRAIANRDVRQLAQAIDDGADIYAYHLDDKATTYSQTGKLPLHLAASTGFKQGVEMLVHLGVDVDSTDMNPRTQNTALHVSTNHRDQFISLLALGADLDIPNHMGYTGRQVTTHADNKLMMQSKPPFHVIVKMFEAVPNREDFTGLRVEDLFSRDEKGLCLMDNPKVLRRMDEVMAEVAKNGRPLDLADLQQRIPAEASYLTLERLPETQKKLSIGVTPARIGEVMRAETDTTYLDRIADVGALDKCISALNAQGKRFHSAAELVKEGEPAGLLKTAAEKHQLRALFTEENWRGASHAELTSVFRAVPEHDRWQVKGYAQLSQKLRAESPSRSGIGR